MQVLLGGLMMVAFFGVGLFQLYAGYVGIDAYLGGWWAIGAGILAVMFRFTLPLAAGAFYAAWHVWGWHWGVALLLAVPGLLFMVPGLIAAVISMVSGRRAA